MNHPTPNPEFCSSQGSLSVAASETECPFCDIVNTYAPLSPSSQPSTEHFDPYKLDPPAFVLLSTKDLIAFFDMFPVTNGHVLVCPRRHVAKIGDMTASESAEIGSLLPLISRAAISACMPDILHTEADYNVVQNNGSGAAQLIPHAHFHIIPRYPIDRTSSRIELQQGVQRRMAWERTVPDGVEARSMLFGRGQRQYRNDDHVEQLVRIMRENVRQEWQSGLNKEKT